MVTHWNESNYARFEHLEKFSLNFSSSPFEIHANLLHPEQFFFLYGLLLCLWCFSILVNCYFQVSFNLKVILYTARIAWLSFRFCCIETLRTIITGYGRLSVGVLNFSDNDRTYSEPHAQLFRLSFCYFSNVVYQWNKVNYFFCTRALYSNAKKRDSALQMRI